MSDIPPPPPPPPPGGSANPPPRADGGDHGLHLPSADRDKRGDDGRRDACAGRPDSRRGRVRGERRLVLFRDRLGSAQQPGRDTLAVTLSPEAPLLESRCSCSGPGQNGPGGPAIKSPTA